VTQPAKPATVRFYLDAAVLGLARVLGGLRSDVTYPGDPGIDRLHGRTRPACPIASPAVKDPDWITQVAGHGWLITTRDSRIQHRRAGIAAVRDSRARMVALTGKEAIGTWAQLEVVMCQWRSIEGLAQQAGPFIYAATRTSLRPVDLR
jgi:hypothetical protein